MNDEELTRMIEPEVQKMGIIQRITSIFVSPGELMRNIKAHPVVWAPLILSIVIGLASLPISLQFAEVMQHEINNLLIELYNIDPAAALAAADEYGAIDEGTVNAASIVGAGAGVVFLTPLLGFIASLGLWILSKIAKGASTLGQMFSMYLHLYVLMTVGSLIATFLMATTGRLMDMTSLAALLMPGGNISMLSFNILTYINIFTIWVNVLAFMGIKTINEFSSVKAGVITGIAFLVGGAFHVITFMGIFILMNMMGA